MSHSRFIRFEEGKRPSNHLIEIALEDYLGGVAEKIEPDMDRGFIATIRGPASNPFRRINGAVSHQEERWFEIRVSGNTIDVLTRMQDELTHNIADGFARLVARYWHGEIELA